MNKFKKVALRVSNQLITSSIKILTSNRTDNNTRLIIKFLDKKTKKVIAGCLSEEEIMGLKQMFKGMDTDNSGTITLEELKQGLSKSGTKLTESEVQQLMEAADADGNGTIDYEEFITATMHMNRMDREEHLYTAFQYFDKDNSG